jgi:hypothetical protein
MKKYLLLLVLLQGCTFPFQNPETMGRPPLRFHFGDKVFVNEGFYEGCRGRVIDYRYWGSGVEYKVTGECPSKDGQYVFYSKIEFNSEELVEDGTGKP